MPEHSQRMIDCEGSREKGVLSTMQVCIEIMHGTTMQLVVPIVQFFRARRWRMPEGGAFHDFPREKKNHFSPLDFDVPGAPKKTNVFLFRVSPFYFLNLISMVPAVPVLVLLRYVPLWWSRCRASDGGKGPQHGITHLFPSPNCSPDLRFRRQHTSTTSR